MHDDYTGKGVDQLARVIKLIKHNPDDRRIIMSAWNPVGKLTTTIPSPNFSAKYTNMHDDYTGKRVDQLARVIKLIKHNPNDRRIIMSAWNPVGKLTTTVPSPSSSKEYTNMHDDYAGKGVDQVARVIKLIKHNPDDRRIIMSAWNPVGKLTTTVPSPNFSAEYTNMHDDYAGKGVDQLTRVIILIKHNPDDRRIIMSAWNPVGKLTTTIPSPHFGT